MKNKPTILLSDFNEDVNKLRHNFEHKSFKDLKKIIEQGEYTIDERTELEIDFTDEDSQCNEFSEYTFKLNNGDRIVITNLIINFDYYADEGDYFNPPSLDVIIKCVDFDDYMWIENDNFEMDFTDMDLWYQIRSDLKDLFE